jgi:NTE family protein
MSQFRNLVFEGGGVRGIAYAGAVEEFERQGVLADIRRIAGTSAGAITAAILACGATSRDAMEILEHTDFKGFEDDSFGVLRDAARLLTEYGLFKGDVFAQWMKRQIASLADDPELTFGGLARLAQQPNTRFRGLYVVGTNLSLQEPRVFSADTTPDVPIWLAVRISMSIPLFFKSVAMGSDVFVDGGMTWNYPLDLFDDRKYLQNPNAFSPANYPTTYGPQHIYNKETLGLHLATKDEIRVEKQGQRRRPKPINNLGDYAVVLVDFMLEAANKAHLHENDWHRTVFIDTLGIKTTDFDLEQKEIAALAASGKACAQAYFTWFNNPANTPLNRV